MSHHVGDRRGVVLLLVWGVLVEENEVEAVDRSLYTQRSSISYTDRMDIESFIVCYLVESIVERKKRNFEWFSLIGDHLLNRVVGSASLPLQSTKRTQKARKEGKVRG